RVREVHRLERSKQEPLPPDLDRVVERQAQRMPIDALELTAPTGQRVVFALRKRRPHVVESPEIGIDVMREIVRELPGAVGRQRRQKGDATDGRVKPSPRSKTAMAGVMAD